MTAPEDYARSTLHSRIYAELRDLIGRHGFLQWHHFDQVRVRLGGGGLGHMGMTPVWPSGEGQKRVHTCFSAHAQNWPPSFKNYLI